MTERRGPTWQEAIDEPKEDSPPWQFWRMAQEEPDDAETRRAAIAWAARQYDG